MGCDGGSIPKRADLVKTKKRQIKDKEAYKNDGWKYCGLSGELLKMPVVACKKGKLYNKMAILEHLLNKDSTRENPIPHIKNLKDVMNLNLTPNEDFKLTSEGVGDDDDANPFICPITGKEMSGNFKFVYLKACGCVMSEAALAQIETDSCLRCGKAKKADGGIVVLNPLQLEECPSSSSIVSAPEPKMAKTQKPLPTPEPLAASSDTLPYLPPKDEHVPLSFSGMATFKKTKAVGSLYNTGKS